jgi:hypothetical protein
MTVYACMCAKDARLHFIGISTNYCSHTVVRGLTRQNYHVWATKLRIFGPHRCIFSTTVAYLRVNTPKSRHVFTTYETSKSFQVSQTPYSSCQNVHYTQRINNVHLFHDIISNQQNALQSLWCIMFNRFLTYWMPYAIYCIKEHTS